MRIFIVMEKPYWQLLRLATEALRSLPVKVSIGLVCNHCDAHQRAKDFELDDCQAIMLAHNRILLRYQ